MSLSQSGTIPKDGKQKGYFVVPHRKVGKRNVIARHEAILYIHLRPPTRCRLYLHLPILLAFIASVYYHMKSIARKKYKHILFSYNCKIE
jgi:hypothetical protein